MRIRTLGAQIIVEFPTIKTQQLKTVLKSFYKSVDEKTEALDLVEVHRKTVSEIGQAASKGIMHKRSADRTRPKPR